MGHLIDEVKSRIKKFQKNWSVTLLYVRKDDNRVPLHLERCPTRRVEWFLCMVPHFLERYVAHDVILPFFFFEMP